MRRKFGAVLVVVALAVSMACAQAEVVYQVIHRFNAGALAGSEGQNPTAGVVIDAKGNLWGTTPWGPSNATFQGGTVYEMTPSGRLLHQFNPTAATVTQNGGTGSGAIGSGLVFKMTVGSDCDK